MAEANETRKLSFSNSWVGCTLVESVQGLSIHDAIVVNLSSRPASYQAGEFCGTIQPFQSRQLKGCTITSAERLGVFGLRTTENLGGLALIWDWFGDRYSGFNREAPLYISPQEEVAEIHFNPAVLFSFDGSGDCGRGRGALLAAQWDLHLQCHGRSTFFRQARNRARDRDI